MDSYFPMLVSSALLYKWNSVKHYFLPSRITEELDSFQQKIEKSGSIRWFGRKSRRQTIDSAYSLKSIYMWKCNAASLVRMMDG